MKLLKHLINLIYPQVCPACGNLLTHSEETVCLSCRYFLPKTMYEKNPENPLAQSFWGQIDFHAVTAEYFFSKTGKVQHLLHQLKYKGNKVERINGIIMTTIFTAFMIYMGIFKG